MELNEKPKVLNQVSTLSTLLSLKEKLTVDNRPSSPSKFLIFYYGIYKYVNGRFDVCREYVVNFFSNTTLWIGQFHPVTPED